MKRHKSAQRTVPRRQAHQGSITGREWILLGLVVAAAISLRLVAFSRSAVEHFDEGVYASNIYFDAPEYAYPLQRFYAPSLLPALIEAGMIVGFAPNIAAMLPNLVAGTATILAIWWFGRSWFGVDAGLAAAVLAALNDFHIALSAAALTDVLLGLWLVLAVDWTARSLVRADLRGAVGAGLLTGLAWWTKYNGWLPVAIEVAALPLLWLVLKPPARQLLGWIGCLAVTALVAALVWSPYYFSLLPTGGYGPIAENHAKYVVGFAGWFDAAARQIANQYAIERLSSALGVAFALALPGFLSSRTTWERVWRGGIGVAAGAMAILWSSFVVVGVGALVGLAQMFVALRRLPADESSQRRAIGLALVAAWWLGLLAATPLYWPYPRLVLPWLVATWLAMSMNCSDCLRVDAACDNRRQRWQSIAGIVLVATVLLMSLLLRPRAAPIDVSFDRRGLMQIAQQIHRTAIAEQPRVIYVYGEPAVFFQLRASGEEIVSAVENVPLAPAIIQGQPVPTWLVVGPQARRDPQFQKLWPAANDRWDLAETYPYRPSAIVWFDIHDPRRRPKDENDDVQLYRLRQESKSR